MPNSEGVIRYNGSNKTVFDNNGVGIGYGYGGWTNADLVVSGSVGIGTLSPNAKLEVSGTVSATHFVGDGSGLTNLSVQGDRITSGTTNVIANQNTGVSVSVPLEVSGTISATTLVVSGTATVNALQLSGTVSVTCDAAHLYSMIADPATGTIQVCRP